MQKGGATLAEFDDKLSAILGNQAAMGQIMALAQSFSGGGDGAQSNPPNSEDTFQQEPSFAPAPASSGIDPLSMLSNLDPRMLQMGMRLFQEYQGNNSDSTALLLALRPYLKPERYAKLDRAVQLAKISRVARVIFSSFGDKGGEDIV